MQREDEGRQTHFATVLRYPRLPPGRNCPGPQARLRMRIEPELQTAAADPDQVPAARDINRSKTAAGRQKDLLALPDLHEIARRNAANGSG